MEQEKFLNSEDTSPLVVRKIRENGNRKESGTRKESTSWDKKSKFSMFFNPHAVGRDSAVKLKF